MSTQLELGRRRLLAGALGSGVAALVSGCAPNRNAVQNGWMTKGATEYALPRWFGKPETPRALVDLVVRAEREGRRIRMTGSGHSFSDVALTDDWLMSPTGLARMLQVDTSALRAGVDAGGMVRVAAGMRIRELNAALDACGLALENMGGFDGQTYVGAASTGTHGSGLAFGPLAAQIASIQVVGPGGIIQQVEPAGGITDPTKFSGKLQEDPSLPVVLTQETALFNALAVSLGCLGIIYSVTLRVVKKFWVAEKRIETSWEELAAPDGLLSAMVHAPTPPPSEQAPDHVEILYSPYARPNGSHAALLTKRWRKATEPSDSGRFPRSGLFVEAFVLLADRTGILLPLVSHYKAETIRHALENALKVLAQKDFAGKSYEIFSVGRYVNELNAYGVELGFDLKDTKAAVERTFVIAGELAANQIFHSAPISLRFVAPAEAHLAMQYGRRTMMMEIDLLVGMPGAEQLLRRYEETFISTLGARPHWGLDRNILRDEATVASLYPESWPLWRAAFDRMNPHGTFDGRITDRLGISKGH